MTNKKERIAELLAEGKSSPEIARQLNTSAGYVREVRAEANIPLPERVIDETPEEVLERAISDERTKVEAKHVKAQLDAAIKREAERDAIADAIREAIVPLPRVDVYKRRGSRESPEGEHAAVAMLSDLHAGEVVEKEAVAGLGEYNWQRFRERLGLWTQVVIDLSEDKRREKHKLDTLTVLLDGDIVSGEIHDDTARTNALGPISTTAATSQLVGHALAQLSRHFESVHVSCTVGNHGRLDRKPRHKEAVERNWDWLTFHMTKQHLAAQPHISWEIPTAKHIVTPVLNERILHMHGDGIPSWLNFPRYGIDRVTKRMRETLQSVEQYFTVVCMGHFHTSEKMDTPAGPIYVNGSFPGVTEFGLQRMHSALPPKQWLLTIHEEHGVIKGEEIFLARATASDAKGLPDVEEGVWE